MNLDPLAILNALPEATLLRDAEGVVRHVNPAAERLLQVRAAEVVGGRDLPHIWHDHLSRGETKFEIYGLDRPTLVEIVPVEGGGSLVVYGDNSWRYYVSGYFDMLREMMSALTPIRGFADLLRLGAGGAVNPQQDEMLETIANNAVKLRREMLLMHHTFLYDTFTPTLVIAAYDINTTIKDLVGLFRELFFDDRVSLALADDLPFALYDRGRVNYMLHLLFDRVLGLKHRTMRTESEHDKELFRAEISTSFNDQHVIVDFQITHAPNPRFSIIAGGKTWLELLEGQNCTFEVEVVEDTCQRWMLKLPIVSEPPT
jgi:hypothetical protein